MTDRLTDQSIIQSIDPEGEEGVGEWIDEEHETHALLAEKVCRGKRLIQENNLMSLE